ncbi:MAG TPA: histidine phosphatase family protein [Longimicrobiales bacterium]|nr:histidine phosphatase family protein [Longimicrobiales bacterium]
MPETIWLVRHGQSEWNAVRRMQGRLESPLSELGHRQAEAAACLLAAHGLDALFTSPLERARETARVVGARVGVEPVADQRIVEWDCGVWSGRLQEEVMRLWPEEWAAHQADPFHYRGPGCENFPDMQARARPFLDELLALEARRVAVVSHGMIGKAMLSLLLGLGPEETMRVAQPNDVIIRLTGTGPAACAHHWRGGEGPFEGLPLRAD